MSPKKHSTSTVIYIKKRFSLTFTCMVKTPSSWEDSFFIWSAKTCASSRMENSVSALQYPQERAEQSKKKLHEKAHKPAWNRRCLSRKAARVHGVKSRGFSCVRLAMMAVGLQAGEHTVWTGGGKKKTSRETTFYNFAEQSTWALSLRYKPPQFPAAQTIATPWNPSRKDSKSMSERGYLRFLTFSLLRLRSVPPTPRSLAKCVRAGDSPQWGWKWEAWKHKSPTGAWISGSMDQGSMMPSNAAGKRGLKETAVEDDGGKRQAKF